MALKEWATFASRQSRATLHIRVQLATRCDVDFCCFLYMACDVAAFLEQFPGEAEVVLVHSEQWTECHRAVMEALTEGVRMFLRTHRHLPFEKLLDEFKESQPCAVVGGALISLLYGREGALYLDENSELKMDIKGLIFTKPWWQMWRPLRSFAVSPSLGSGSNAVESCVRDASSASVAHASSASGVV